MKIGIITSTVREGRQSIKIAEWLNGFAQNRNDGNTYEIVDIKNYNLPVMGTAATEEQIQAIDAWASKINELDGFVFVVAEYNHGITGALKNALDYLKPQFANKAAALVGFGGVGGARAIEQLRMVLAEMKVATVQRNVNLFLSIDFENFSEFKPQGYHGPIIDEMLTQLNDWAKALKTLR